MMLSEKVVLQKNRKHNCCRHSLLISVLLPRALSPQLACPFLTFLGFVFTPGYILTSKDLELRITSAIHMHGFSCKKNDAEILIGMALNHISSTLVICFLMLASGFPSYLLTFILISLLNFSSM